MPADHLFDETEFKKCIVDLAIPFARQFSSIVTLGIRPSYPATGFGYIEIDSLTASDEKSHPVVHFHEKPCAALAEAYVSGGKHFWNAGVFVASVGTLLDEFLTHCPALLSNQDTPKLSFDRAVMEHTKNAHMVVYKGDWSDLGSWSDVYKVNRRNWTDATDYDQTEQENQENVVLGSGDVHCDDTCARNLVYSNSKTNVALCNVSDVIVVVADNGDVLVMRNDETSSQNLKRLVEQINKKR